MIALGVNIDHVATLRNARGGNDPSLLELFFEVQDGGADSVTMHLREDRRHIRDADIFEIKKHAKIPINLEMAISTEMTEIACQLQPKWVCLVPEKRQEVTTEGGLNLEHDLTSVRKCIHQLQQKQIEVFPFLDADLKMIQKAKDLGCNGVEIHTGVYAHSFFNHRDFQKQLTLLNKSAELCLQLGLEFHAGHGLNYQNISFLKTIQNLTEVNVGHSIIARALKTGLKSAVSEFKILLNGPGDRPITASANGHI